MANISLKLKERAFILEFIKVYRNLPSLWNVKCKEYHDRDRKYKDYNILTEKYTEMYPNATIVDVKKKLNILRSNYRRKLRISLQALESGDDNKIKCKSGPWYYNEMHFLQDQEILGDSQMFATEMDRDKMEFQNFMSSEDEDSKPDLSRSTLNTSQSSISHVTPEKRPKRNSRNGELKLKKEALTCAIQAVTCKCYKPETDCYQHWALACATDLKKMEPTQQIFAKRAIAEILMEGSLGLLHRNSVKVNDLLAEQYTDPLSISSTQKNFSY